MGTVDGTSFSRWRCRANACTFFANSSWRRTGDPCPVLDLSRRGCSAVAFVWPRGAGRKINFRRIDHFNQLSDTLARNALHDCCGAKKWTERMLARRPFLSADQLFESAGQVWGELGGEDWLEAFHHHPAIGAKRASEKLSGQARRWAAREQSVAQKAAPETLALLAAANEAYRTVFGYVFLICATGKTTEQPWSLQKRLLNGPETELRIAAEEQRKITRLRLEKLLAS